MDEQPEFVERERAYQRAYYLKHRVEKVAYARARWCQKKDYINAQRRHGTRRSLGIGPVDAGYNRRYHLEVMVEKHLRERVRVLQVVAGVARPVCVRCGVADIRALNINHINGRTGEEVRSHASMRRFAQALLDGSRSTEDLNVLCCNCNTIYEYDRGQRRLPRDWQSIVEEEIGDGRRSVSK